MTHKQAKIYFYLTIQKYALSCNVPLYFEFIEGIYNRSIHSQNKCRYHSDD